LSGYHQESVSSVEVEGELEYEVKEILDSKISRGKLKYLMEWEGYEPDERSWESAENIQNTVEIITEFHQYYPNRPVVSDLSIS
jgi:uncharacterized protein YicC (UPF0701 family)